MERIDILAAGKIRESYYRDAMAEYGKRLSRYVKLNLMEVADGPDKKAEGSRMLERLPEDAYIITLEINGKALSSEELSQKISELENSGRSRIVFIIGGPDGLHSDVLARSDFSLSFSKMTFPHPLMRVILMEQIYRAYRIMKGEPYHK